MTRPRRYLYFVLLAVAVLAVALWIGRRGRDRDRTPRNRASAESRDQEPSTTAPAQDRDFSFGRQYRYSATAPMNQVTGTVIDAADGQAVPNVDVTFRRGKPETTVTSGADGRYSVELSPGTYEVRAVGADTFALPQPQLKVGRLGETVVFDVYVVKLATVRGTVSYANGRPAAEAEIIVRESSEGARDYVKTGELAGAVAGPDGRFELSVLPGTVELRATDGELTGFARVEAVQAGSTRTGVEIVLEDNTAVAGVVLDPRRQPVAGAEVTVSVQRPRTHQYERTIRETDSSGRFEVSVRPGRTVVVAVAEGYAPAEEQIAVLEPGARREFEVLLQSPLTLAGRVVDADGRPVVGAVVSHLRYDSKLRTVSTTTGLDGRFSFSPVGPGPHALVAELADYGKASTDQATAPADDIELRLAPYGGVRGTVSAEDDTRIVQFVAVVEKGGRAVGAASASRFMAGDGRYELFPLEPGRCDVVVFAPGYAPTRKRELEVPPGGWADGSVILTSGGTVAGIVRSARTGAPVAGAQVSATSGHRDGAVTTSSDGRFALRHVAPGMRVLTVVHPRHVTLRSGEIEVAAGEETTVELSLVPVR